MTAALAVIPADDDAVLWARIAVLARILEAEGADLSDETDAWRALMRRGVAPGEAFKLARDAMRHAIENPSEIV